MRKVPLLQCRVVPYEAVQYGLIAVRMIVTGEDLLFQPRCIHCEKGGVVRLPSYVESWCSLGRCPDWATMKAEGKERHRFPFWPVLEIDGVEELRVSDIRARKRFV